MKEVTIDGVTYESAPGPTDRELSCCEGCAGERNNRLCHKLPDCGRPYHEAAIIWVKQP